MDLMFGTTGYIIAGVLLFGIMIVVSMKFLFKNSSQTRVAHSTAVRLNPANITQEVFMAPPSEQLVIRDKYLGLQVEFRTILNSVKKSYENESLRELLLNSEEDHAINIVGSVNLADYDNRSWMQKGGKVNVQGEISEIKEKVIKLSHLSILQ